MCENQDPNLPVVSNYYSMNCFHKNNENIEFNNLKMEKFHQTDIDSTNTVQFLHSIKIEDEIPLFECYQCQTIFKNRRELLFHQDFDHIDLVEKPTLEKDVVALASIYQTDSFKFKIKLHTNENQPVTAVKKPLVKPPKIELEDASQDSKNNVSNNNPLICPLCNLENLYQFKSNSGFRQHMTKCHKHNAKLFEKSQKNCKFCNAVFSSYDELVWHYYFCLNLCYTKKLSKKKINGLSYLKPPPKLFKLFKCCMCLQNETFSEEPFKIHLMLEHNLYKTNRFPREKRQCIYCGGLISSYRILYEHCKDCAVDRFL